MDTLGYVLIFTALAIIRAVTRGRSLTDIPGDLGDAFVAAVSVDMAGVREALNRTGDAQDVTAPVTAETPPASAPTGKADKAALVAFGKRLQGIGYSVSEHPSFGGVTPGAHVANSQHYIGEAIDVNADKGFRHGEKDALDAAQVMAKAAGFSTLWQVSGHFDHLHVAVPK